MRKGRGLGAFLSVVSLMTGSSVERGEAMKLTSSAFNHGGEIPSLYTCDGEDLSPPLAWEEVPQGTQSLVLIADDPDAPMGTWDHWILFNLSPQVTSLPENLDGVPAGAKGGKNSWKRNDYGGPCPPDRRHNYHFKLYALDTLLSLETGASKAEIESAMKGHILAETVLIASYDRPGRS